MIYYYYKSYFNININILWCSDPSWLQKKKKKINEYKSSCFIEKSKLTNASVEIPSATSLYYPSALFHLQSPVASISGASSFWWINGSFLWIYYYPAPAMIDYDAAKRRRWAESRNKINTAYYIRKWMFDLIFKSCN